ncbi:uncharacterized protein KD926_010243 [Aspergillus affinis]|uniref:uncharacterized protein n=1 Tax=Aspergillus affinis TaxID=1070780 RepID=UPI0022FE2FAF|nr:uncharacterized protein KD926_010243 [Aspergillus affinis]KAI9038787.1 hypothetical protein KD926_010243 [Aspergillus affinis]
MKLRSSIRPPKRFNSEEFECPYSEVNLRRTPKSIERPPIIEFNPNLPPAAFPTLDKPRPPGSNDDKIDNGQDSSDEEMEFEDLAFTEIENLKASNGPLNPIYLRNMALMANAGRGSHMDFLDLQESFGDRIDNGFDGGLSESAPILPDPQWRDILMSLKVEIFGNLLQSCSWSHACIRLGLSVRDQVELRGAWTERDKQLDYEDEQLEKMREDRLRALMRIDNSLLNRDQHSIWTLFCKTRRQARHNIQVQQRESCKNFFMCNTDEIAIAKRFLEKWGLSPKLVGEWCNTIPVVEGPDGEESDSDDLEPRTLKWNLKPTGIDISGLQPGIAPPRNNATASNKPTVSTASKVSLINDIHGFGPSTSARQMDASWLRSGVVNSVSRWINAPSQPTWPNGLVNLNIGMQRAAQVQPTTEPQLVEPTRLARQTPPQDRISQVLAPTVEGASYTYVVSSYPAQAPRRRPPSTRPEPEEPVRRTLGGCWSYLSAGPNQNLATTATRPLRTRRGGTRSGLRNEITRTDGSNDQRPPAPLPDEGTEIPREDRSSNGKCPASQPEHSSLPKVQPTTTRNRRCPSVIDLDGYNSATSYRGLPPSHDGQISRTASPVPVDEGPREETDSMTITPPTSDIPLALASQVSENEETVEETVNDNRWEESEDEDDMELDEMVLVPCFSN